MKSYLYASDNQVIILTKQHILLTIKYIASK